MFLQIIIDKNTLQIINFGSLLNFVFSFLYY